MTRTRFAKRYYIYLITNLTTGMQYIGSRTKFRGDPLLTDAEYMSSSKYVKQDIERLGIQMFTKGILEQGVFVDRIQLGERESIYINELNTLAPNGYNRYDPGKNPGFNMSGNKPSEKTLQKRKDTKKEHYPNGWKPSEKSIQQAKATMKKRYPGGYKYSKKSIQKVLDTKKERYPNGLKQTEAAKQKSKATRKEKYPDGFKMPKEAMQQTKDTIKKRYPGGYKHSEEAKRKISEIQKGRPSSYKGKKRNPHSEEAKRKISEAGKRPCLEETKRKISESNKGRKRLEESIQRSIDTIKKKYPDGYKMSEESKRKNSEAHKGIKKSEETKQNMRAAWVKRKENSMILLTK